MAHLLIVEDDELLRDALAAQLAQAGHGVETAANGAIAQARLEGTRFDGVILDLGLPVVDGMAVLRWIRQRLLALPVLILTARDGVDDRVQGLNAGADDYLTKPFSMAELEARLQALLRRSRLPAFGGSLEVAEPSGRRLRVDPVQPLAWLGDEPLELTQREWSLLALLVAHTGQVVSREDVLAAWQTTPAENTANAGNSGNAGHAGNAAGAAGLASNALEVYVHRLRRKLGESGLVIRNVRGLGYLLEPSAE